MRECCGESPSAYHLGHGERGSGQSAAVLLGAAGKQLPHELRRELRVARVGDACSATGFRIRPFFSE